MAKTNYNYEKRARELEKQKKKEEKKKKKEALKNNPETDETSVTTESAPDQEV